MSRKISRSSELAGKTPLEAASYWLVRQDAGSLSAQELIEFEAWLAADATHREAFAQTQSVWGNFENEADSSELRALRVAALSVPGLNVPADRGAWWRLGVGVAAAAVLILGVAAYVAHDAAIELRSVTEVAADHHAADIGERYLTAHNERSTVTLSDGSMVTLNLGTALDVRFTATERLVRIRRGQAFFEVAKDVQRPFVVAAADRRVTALGTQFDVRLDPDRVEVVLLEGKVAVDPDSPTVLERLKVRKAHIELKPGQKLVAALGEPVTVTGTNARRATSWRQGWVEFDNETVGAAVAELNRYTERPLLVPEESVRNLRLSGVFKVGQPERFATIIQELLPVRVVRGTVNTVLVSAESADGTIR